MHRYASYLLSMRSQLAVLQCRVVLAVLVLSLVTGCALRGRRQNDGPSPAGDTVAGRLDGYPLGTLVHLRLGTGETVDGALVWVDAEQVSVEPKPGDPARMIARSSIVAVTAYTTAVHKAKTAMFGTLAAIGAGLLLLIIAAGPGPNGW